MYAWTLCTEQDVRDIQTIPDTIPESWSTRVEGLIRQHTGLNRLGLAVVTFEDTRSGDDSTLMRIKKSPISTLNSLTISDYSVASTNIYVGEYFVQLKNGLTFTRGVRNVVINYDAGGGDVTEDITMAAAQMIVAISNYYGRQGADASLKWSTMMEDGRDHTRGGEAGPSKRMGLSAHLESIMLTTIKTHRIKIG